MHSDRVQYLEQPTHLLSLNAKLGGGGVKQHQEVRLGQIDFEDLTFGVFDAMSDLSVVASGEYELEPLDDEE